MASQAAASAYLGPPLVGWILQVTLWGAVFNSMFTYTATTQYERDPKWTKILLWVVVGLDTAVAFVNFAEIYHYGVSQKRDAATLFLVLTMDAVCPVLIGCCGFLVQGFLALRAARMFKLQRYSADVQRYARVVFFGVIGAAMTMSLLASIGATILFVLGNEGMDNTYKAAPFTFNNLAGSWMWISAGVDITITCALVFGLRQHLSDFSESTNTLLRNIMSISMRTALYTSLYGLLGAIFGVAFPATKLATSDILLAFTSPLASLYTLSLLHNLAARDRTNAEHLQAQQTPSYRLPINAEEKEGDSRLGAVMSRGVHSLPMHHVTLP
ncbi:hypothetical protein RQP46_004248 [Phenoliferia psychrophenolica]